MEILLSGVVSFAICLLCTPFLIKLLTRLKAIDMGGGRKIHKGSVPTMGGLAIFVALMATIVLLSGSFQFTWKINYFLGAVSLMFLLGFTDDALDLPAGRKLLVMVIGATMVYMANIRITSMYGFFGIYDLPTVASYLVTVFTVIVVVNAYNLVDGVDGLAGGIGVTTLFFFGLWFVASGKVFGAVFCMSFTGALLAFLKYNWSPARIFMGDTGSLTIGMASAICAITFINNNSVLPDGDPLKFKGFVAAGVTFVAYPMYDTLRVFIIRMTHRRSPFSPDTQHTHHYLLRQGYGHSKTTSIILACNVACMLLFWLFSYYVSSYYVVPVILVVSLSVSLVLSRMENRRKRSETELAGRVA